MAIWTFPKPLEAYNGDLDNSAFGAAGTLAERSGWRLTNLSLQKLVYLAQMIHLGQTEKGDPLFPEDFEAWNYGPVIPGLYHALKMFGANPVAPYATLGRMEPKTDLQKQIFNDLTALGERMRPGQLIAITHWEKGAWSKAYRENIKNLMIPQSDIRQEYLDRITE